MDKVIVIVGPTASGKSALAIEAAKRLNGEVISADSMQVYKTMDIGTAKITEEETDGVPHHLIDLMDPDGIWNVKTFQEACRKAITDITARHKVPILCGGTGLYLKAALYDYHFDEESDEDSEPIRKELEALSNKELWKLLEQKDPKALEKIHPNNRKRLLRAALMAQSDRPKSQREQAQNHEPVYDVYFVGLKDEDRSREIERINKRVDMMFEAGLVEEVTKIFSDPKTWSWNSFQGIGYKEFKPYFQNEQTLGQVREQIKIHTRQYARRQMTWFNHQMPVHWYPVGKPEVVLKDLENWYGITDTQTS